MSSRLHFILQSLLLLVLALSAATSAQQLQPGPAPIPDGLQTIEFFSPAVNRNMKFDIVLPEDYEQTDQRYPVLYLLHGYMQNYTVWGRNLSAAYYAREVNDLIVVLPDGGNTWFVNYATVENNNWEDHIVQDVVNYVDRNFRSEVVREGRAIAGLSMGGFAALAIGLRNPDKFISLGSTSGALSWARTQAAALAAGIDGQNANLPQRNAADQARFEQADAFIADIIDIPGFSTQEERTPQAQPFASAEQAKAYDPFEIIYTVPKSQLPHIYLDSGTEDGLVGEARELAQVLMLNNVPFDYMQSRGRHNSEYWRRSIGHMMAIQAEVMQRALGNRP
jgi:putative tributyrin esterase